MNLTYAAALGMSGITIPDHLIADAEVPVLNGVQAQGDLLIVPWHDDRTDESEAVPMGTADMEGLAEWERELLAHSLRTSDAERPELRAVPDKGIAVVQGGPQGNDHILHRGFESPDVAATVVTALPRRERLRFDDLTVAVVMVPAAQSAVLVHTDEHGANGIGEGTYLIKRKRQLFARNTADFFVSD